MIRLTPREREILAILGRLTGAKNQQIADELGMAENTVKVYICRLMSKAGIPREERNRGRLAGMAGRLLGGGR